MRALGVDCGFDFGWGMLEHGHLAESGTRRVEGTSTLLGKAGRSVDRIMRELIQVHRPTVVAFASPFIARRGKVTPVQLRPIMSFPTIVEMICEELHIQCVEWDEHKARLSFLGEGNLPNTSEKIKKAVMQDCRDRGWPVMDDHAGDALCIAAYTLNRLCPDQAHQTQPLFQAAPPARRRQTAAAAPKSATKARRRRAAHAP